MGNSVSFAGSRSHNATLSRPRDDNNNNNNTPQVFAPSPSPSSSSSSLPTPSNRGRCFLTSSPLSTQASRLANLFRWPTSGRRTHIGDVEEGLPSTGHFVPGSEAVAMRPAPSSRCRSSSFSGRRRALLIGISYRGELLNTHKDVDRYRGVLLEDITVLKDDPALPSHLQPTRENILRELRRLVADAAPGDRFTFLYSGHSNQQRSKDLNEEDFKDEYLITIDDDIVVDNELNDILVMPLPAGCSLFALLDTCHSGTLLDLPHYHCNSVYVPWRSKGKRRTKSWQNVTVRRNAAPIQGPFCADPAARPPLSIADVFARSKSAERIRSVLPVFVTIH
ncbi:caspase domain-containing protein [Multifurca ochricompacta]|uniref:Caspase domain-containing protein n=1 Tax=Multifurca ochricompacta TaxID=376703 RepID=A0AAD4M1C6_9AGAM|nr:caspase domain-containing protein [Multifurca ochricompacta]